jgi:hypothetical protein
MNFEEINEKKCSFIHMTVFSNCLLWKLQVPRARVNRDVICDLDSTGQLIVTRLVSSTRHCLSNRTVFGIRLFLTMTSEVKQKLQNGQKIVGSVHS